MPVCRECYVLSGRSLCDGLITRPGEFYRVYVCVWCRAVHHPYRTHDLRSGSQDHHPSKNSVQKTICCNSTSNAPDDGLMYPKHV